MKLNSLLQMQIKADNEKAVNDKYYDCPKCRNKGVIYYADNGIEKSRPCDCEAIRQTYKRIEKSGLKSFIEDMKFNNYVCEFPFQVTVKQKALSFLTAPEGSFFFIGGQTGAGKTHICTAISNGFIEKGKEVLYFTWAVRLKEVLQLSGNDTRTERTKVIEPLKNTNVVYLDDFLNSDKPTSAEISLAFEIINERYNKKLTTIISSEKRITEIKKIKDSLCGRIYERTSNGDFCFWIPRKDEYNYRYK